MDESGRRRLQQVHVGGEATEIVEMEARLRAAQLSADVPALDELISDDLLFVGPDGQLATKEADVEAHRSGAVRFLRHEPIELRTRPIGPDVTLVALLAELEVEVAGHQTSGTYRYTRVWTRVAPKSWQVVGGHVSEVPDGSLSPD